MKNFSKFLLIFLILFRNNFANEKFVMNVHNNIAGFFSAFFGVLNKLIWCEKNNKVPVVYWNDIFLYYNPDGYDGNFNCWEYYFEPVSNLVYESGDQIYYDFHAADKFVLPMGLYNMNKYLNTEMDEILFIHEIIKKYIKIKSNIQTKIDNFYNENMLGKHTIGIHLRGTDKHEEAKPVELNKIFEEAINKSKEIDDCQFFIATDEEKLLALAKEVLKKTNKKIIYYDSYRSTNGFPIHHVFRNSMNKAKLGEEILIEVILLSKCDWFIRTTTNVADAVMYFNPSIKVSFLRAN